MHGIAIASIERAADHGGALGIVFLAAAVAGLVYLVVKRRGPGA